MATTNYSKMDLNQLKKVMIERYDGNAGEIWHGFVEMGLKGERLKAALVRYIERVPAYAGTEDSNSENS